MKEAGRKALNSVGDGYLEKYKTAVKVGQVKDGDFISITDNGLKINNKEINK